MKTMSLFHLSRVQRGRSACWSTQPLSPFKIYGVFLSNV